MWQEIFAASNFAIFLAIQKKIPSKKITANIFQAKNLHQSKHTLTKILYTKIQN